MEFLIGHGKNGLKFRTFEISQFNWLFHMNILLNFIWDHNEILLRFGNKIYVYV